MKSNIANVKVLIKPLDNVHIMCIIVIKKFNDYYLGDR